MCWLSLRRPGWVIISVISHPPQWKSTFLTWEKTQTVWWTGYANSLYHGSGPNTPTLILALQQSQSCQVSTVPSVSTSEKDTKENPNWSQSISREPLSVILQGLTPKPWLRKHIHIYPFCVSPKKAHATVFQILLPWVTEHKQDRHWRSNL